MHANLAMIVSSGKRLASLVDSILDFSKLKTRNLELQRKPLGIRSLTDAALKLSEPLIALRKNSLLSLSSLGSRWHHRLCVNALLTFFSSL